MKIISLLTSLILSAQIASAEPMQEGTYNIDIDHTNIGFSVGHQNISFVVGRFNKFSGSFTKSSTNASVQIEIETNSIDTNQSRRDQHLRSDDFFDSAQFPKIIFASTSVESDSDGYPTSIIGTLTLHGVSKEVKLAVQKTGSGDDHLGSHRVGFTATAAIKRTDFGMNKLLAAASDDVQIQINLEGIKQ